MSSVPLVAAGSRCPACGVRFEHPLRAPEAYEPAQGDLVACPACAAVLALDQELRPRLTTREELSRLPEGDREAVAEARRQILGLPKQRAAAAGS